MIRIFIVDDHSIVRDGIRAILETTSDLEWAGCAADGNGALSALADADVDVVVLDIALPSPGPDGVEVLHRLRERRPELHVVIYTLNPEDRYAARWVRAGAAACLSKVRPVAELLEAIRGVARGDAQFAAVLEQRLQAMESVAAPEELLSPREHEIVQMLVQGRSPKEIAGVFDVTLTTVSTHFRRIKAKLGVSTNAEIIRYALESRGANNR